MEGLPVLYGRGRGYYKQGDTVTQTGALWMWARNCEGGGQNPYNLANFGKKHLIGELSQSYVSCVTAFVKSVSVVQYRVIKIGVFLIGVAFLGTKSSKFKLVKLKLGRLELRRLMLGKLILIKFE